jgi:hypothetical protein
MTWGHYCHTCDAYLTSSQEIAPCPMGHGQMTPMGRESD